MLNEQVFQTLVENGLIWKSTDANKVGKFGWEVNDSEHVMDVGMSF